MLVGVSVWGGAWVWVSTGYMRNLYILLNIAVNLRLLSEESVFYKVGPVRLGRQFLGAVLFFFFRSLPSLARRTHAQPHTCVCVHMPMVLWGYPSVLFMVGKVFFFFFCLFVSFIVRTCFVFIG